MYSKVTNSTFKRPGSPLANKRKEKPPKVIPTIEDLLASGAITSGSKVKPTKTTKPKKSTKTRKINSESQSEDDNDIIDNTNDSLVGENIRMIGKCIKYIQPGVKFNEWITNNFSMLESFNSIPKAELRYLISKTAKELFGIEQLRTLQKDAVVEFIRPTRVPNHIVVLAGTGSGKSLIYWLSAVLQEFSKESKAKLTVIVSPLISLLNDQFLQIEPTGIPTAIYYGKVSTHARKELFERVKAGEMRIIYTTPEKSISRPFMSLLEEIYENFEVQIVVDEAHCISEWGHDFRPQYMNLKKLRQKFENIPILCTTATATPSTLRDIQKTMNIPYAIVMKGDLTRSNLHYTVRTKSPEYVREIADMIRNKWNEQCGIVYCLTRGDADKLNQSLIDEGILSAAYHSGLTEGLKNRVQADWMQNKIRVMVATVAFGMGIDKPDVRFVIHSCMPTSLEAYYQQAGRAGRDGKHSTCVLFFRNSDRAMASSVISSSTNSSVSDEFPVDIQDEQSSSSYLDRKQEQLDDIVSYAQNKTQCRQIQILGFFNEPIEANYRCNYCDVCEASAEVITKSENIKLDKE